MTEPTPIQVSDARLREILAGTEGVTPGPWFTTGAPWFRSEDGVLAGSPDGNIGYLIADCEDAFNARDEYTGPFALGDKDADAAHIARLDPATVASIIAELLERRSAQTSPAVEVVPAGFDVTDMDMIRRGDRIGPKLGARVADALVAASSSPPSVSSEPVADPAEYRIPANQEWPHSGPDFNAWEDDVFALVAKMAELKDQPWWCNDSQLKYLSLWIDTRDGGFILKDRDRNRVSPDRVIKALDGWREFVGKR